ncbi:MAG: ATP-dependent DNA helicase RecG [Erysipelotrichales bacterium]
MDLYSNLSELKFTAKQQELFTKLELNTILDLINKYPSRYNFIIPTSIEDNSKVVIEAKINSEVKIAYFRGKMNRIYFDVINDNQIIKVVIFNRAFLLQHLKNTSTITIMGTYTAKNNTLVASEIKFKPLSEIKGIYPVYNLGNNYKNNDYINLISKVIASTYPNIKNVLPDDLVSKYKLLQRKDAIRQIHFPQSKEHLLQANRSLVYEEFFIYSLKNIIKKNNMKADSSLIKDIDNNDITTLVDTLSYTLTQDQKNVLNEIYVDFKSPFNMNRLLLADVGSGKTLVALIAVYMIYMAGYQSALMAPTTILAMQHYESAMELFSDVEINIAILTSNTNPIERENILEDLRKGKIDLLIGTHAIYQEDVIYKNLGFVVYDEQQRFGVKQRDQLRDKGNNIEQLMLSATPIPRTLAQVAYAAIQISYMKETLPFKKEIKSYFFKSNSIKPFYDKMIELLEKKQQIYIVTPLVEESETINTKNVIDVYENIKEHFSNKYSVGLIHGKLDNDTKQNTMIEFANHEYDILVATSLIEVGISVSNANCIIIYDAHRFGLSQLHQLRGRVGRGSEQGYCVFLSTSKEPETIEKMEYITSHNDGFAIAEYDMLMRGPGDLLGVKQSGIPSFNIADLIKDEKIYHLAYDDAKALFDDKEAYQKWRLSLK